VWFQRIQAAVKSKAACFTVSIVGYFFRLLYGLVSFRIELNELISARRRNDIDRFVEGECSRRFRLPSSNQVSATTPSACGRNRSWTRASSTNSKAPVIFRAFITSVELSFEGMSPERGEAMILSPSPILRAFAANQSTYGLSSRELAIDNADGPFCYWRSARC
jgi:hypothetical protein